MSYAEFLHIQDGMTHDQVEAIVGSYGTLSVSGTGDTVIYTWQGEGSLGANAEVMFQAGVVINKAQAGLR